MTDAQARAAGMRQPIYRRPTASISAKKPELEEWCLDNANKDNWLNIAGRVISGENIFSSSSQWESARIGLEAINCPLAAARCATEVKFLKARGK